MSRKYNSIQRENWIKSMQPNFLNQTWHSDQVYHPSHIKYYKFFKRNGSYRGKINLQEIHGLEYAYSYNCTILNPNNKINWKYMLHWLKRLDRVIDNFKTRKELIEHIHNDSDPKTVYKYGNHFFTISGQHRLCLAKFLELDEIEVNILDFRLDKALFIREKYVEKKLSKLIEYKMISKDYINDINDKYLHLRIQNERILIDKEFINYLIVRYELLKRKKYKSIYNIFRRIFKSNNNNMINKEEELYLLDYLLIKHLRIQSSTK